jgi:hypothetical protein
MRHASRRGIQVQRRLDLWRLIVRLDHRQRDLAKRRLWVQIAPDVREPVASTNAHFLGMLRF